MDVCLNDVDVYGRTHVPHFVRGPSPRVTLKVIFTEYGRRHSLLLGRKAFCDELLNL
jgi:hypothetical protein